MLTDWKLELFKTRLLLALCDVESGGVKGSRGGCIERGVMWGVTGTLLEMLWRVVVRWWHEEGGVVETAEGDLDPGESSETENFVTEFNNV